jgi:hypothetical protein
MTAVITTSILAPTIVIITNVGTQVKNSIASNNTALAYWYLPC